MLRVCPHWAKLHAATETPQEVNGPEHPTRAPRNSSRDAGSPWPPPVELGCIFFSAFVAARNVVLLGCGGGQTGTHRLLAGAKPARKPAKFEDLADCFPTGFFVSPWPAAPWPWPRSTARLGLLAIHETSAESHLRLLGAKCIIRVSVRGFGGFEPCRLSPQLLLMHARLSGSKRDVSHCWRPRLLFCGSICAGKTHIPRRGCLSHAERDVYGGSNGVNSSWHGHSAEKLRPARRCSTPKSA